MREQNRANRGFRNRTRKVGGRPGGAMMGRGRKRRKEVFEGIRDCDCRGPALKPGLELRPTPAHARKPRSKNALAAADDVARCPRSFLTPASFVLVHQGWSSQSGSDTRPLPVLAGKRHTRNPHRHHARSPLSLSVSFFCSFLRVFCPSLWRAPGEPGRRGAFPQGHGGYARVGSRGGCRQARHAPPSLEPSSAAELEPRSPRSRPPPSFPPRPQGACAPGRSGGGSRGSSIAGRGAAGRPGRR